MYRTIICGDGTHYDYILDLGHIIYKVLVISSGGEFA